MGEMEERLKMDEKITRHHAIERVAVDLGLNREGHHFFCPGCQMERPGRPEMVIKDGHFRCFRCGVFGDVVVWGKLARGCTLEEAMAWLNREIEPSE